MITITNVFTTSKGTVETNIIKSNFSNDICKSIGDSFKKFLKGFQNGRLGESLIGFRFSRSFCLMIGKS